MESGGWRVEGGRRCRSRSRNGFQAAQDPAFVEDAFDQVHGAGDRWIEQRLLNGQRAAGLFLEDVGQARGLASNHNHPVAVVLLFLHLGDDRLDLAAEAGPGHKMTGQSSRGGRGPALQIAVAQHQRLAGLQRRLQLGPGEVWRQRVGR